MNNQSHSGQNIISNNINFNGIAWFAQRAKAAYLEESQIVSQLPNVTKVVQLDDIDVQYFIEASPDNNKQIISIRGTANLDDALQDAEYWQCKNKHLGIYLETGFDKDSYLVYQDLLQYLDKSKQIVLTGHSLGAAISTILMMYLSKDNYNLAPSINFGQPKVTNTRGVKRFSYLPLLRVVDENDVVPLVPSATLLDSIHGFYQHFGEQLTLLKDEYYAYLPQKQAIKQSRGSFWKNVTHISVEQHYMENYEKNIVSKKDKATQVPYADREKYIA